MPKIIPKETIDRIREEVRKGRSRYDLADEFGVSVRTVYRYTRELSINHAIPPETREEIRKRVEELRYRSGVAKEFGISPQTVLNITKDMKMEGGNYCIKGKALDMLKDLLEKGYAFSSDTSSVNRTLKKHFPSIQRAEADGRSIYFLEGKAEKAANAFLRSKRKKVMSYQELKGITKLFGVDLSKEEKKVFVGKSHKGREIRTKKKSDRKEKRRFKDLQTKLDEFIGKFFHSELLNSADEREVKNICRLKICISQL
jgi:hypothetical protein